MFPLRDVHKPARVPLMTRLFIAVNLLFFGYQIWLALQGGETTFINQMGVRPHCYFSPSSCGIVLPTDDEHLWQPLLVSLFLHGGFLHLAFNMLFLSVFGPGVEDRLGRWRYFWFYLGCGIVASLAHIFTNPFSNVPTIGASGAIAGVLGAYFILMPRSWILTYLPPIFLFPVPAPLFLLAWFAGQFVSALGALPLSLPGAAPAEGGVAWMAHLGGFAVGVAVGWSIKPWWKRAAK